IMFLLLLTVAGASLIVVAVRSGLSFYNSASRASDQSIAVLPLVDLSESKDQEYLCDGVSDELLDTLAKVPGLRVAARTSAFSFKGKNVATSEIAGKLGVANLLEGSLRREGNRIRVTAQLINARDGFHLWSDTFERELRDVFAVEDEITHAIVDALKVKLTVGAPLHAGKADPEAFLKESRRAVEVDPNSALAHIWFGDSFRARGNLTKAIEQYHIAMRLDPLSPIVSDSLAEGYMIAGKLDEAIAQGKRTLELDSTYAYLDSTLANAYREKGLFDEAIAIYRQGEQITHAHS